MLSDGSEGVKHLSLKSGFHHENVDMDFFAVFQFPHRISVIFLDELVGEADGGFDEFLHGCGQEFVDVFIIVVVVPNAEDHVDVVPNGSSEHERVDARMRRHRAVRHVFRHTQFIVEQIAAFGVVETVQDGESVFLPRIVLDAE